MKKTFLDLNYKELGDRELLEVVFLNQVKLAEKLNRLIDFVGQTNFNNPVIIEKRPAIDAYKELIEEGIRFEKEINQSYSEQKK
jgi:hypothetical protein